MMFGVLIGGISPMSYALDAFRDISNELFIMNMLFKVRYSIKRIGLTIRISCFTA
jgi:hypothetical protein